MAVIFASFPINLHFKRIAGADVLPIFGFNIFLTGFNVLRDLLRKFLPQRTLREKHNEHEVAVLKVFVPFVLVVVKYVMRILPQKMAHGINHGPLRSIVKQTDFTYAPVHQCPVG